MFTVDTVAPTVTFGSPAADAVVGQGDAVLASFACADERSGLESCASTVASGGLLDTATLGVHILTISARDRAGNTRVERRSYTVVARVAGQSGPLSPIPGGPPIVQRPADAGLAIGTASARRAGRRVVTVSVAGTVVPAAAGRVTVTATEVPGAGRRATTTIRKGRWHLTLRIRLAGRTPARLRLTVDYSGDRSHRTKSLHRRVSITSA